MFVHVLGFGYGHLARICRSISAIDIRCDTLPESLQDRLVDFAARDGEATERARIVVLNPGNLQHALAHRRDRAHISDLLALDGLEDLLRIEALVEKHGSAVVND